MNFVARQFQRNALFALCFFLISMQSFAEQSNAAFTPARFGDGLPAFIEKLRFPEHRDGPAILIRCEGMVHLSGDIQGAICFSDNNIGIERRMRQVIVRATRTTRITPATINRERTNVRINFSVIYEQKGDEKLIEILENHLYDIELLGPNYVAAQRVILQYNLFCFDLRELPILATAMVSGQGEVTALQLSKDPQHSQCAGEAEEKMRNAVYIPATVDGSAVASTFHEAFHHYLYDPLR